MVGPAVSCTFVATVTSEGNYPGECGITAEMWVASAHDGQMGGLALGNDSWGLGIERCEKNIRSVRGDKVCFMHQRYSSYTNGVEKNMKNKHGILCQYCETNFTIYIIRKSN